MSEKRWLSVHSYQALFQDVALGWHNSRNVTAEDLQEMLDNDEPIPIEWYRRTDKGFEISEGFDNLLHAARIIEYETNGKVDWCELACQVIEQVAASGRASAYVLSNPPWEPSK